MKKEFIGTGRRKSAVSSVRMREGSGEVMVNGRPFEVYFPLAIQRDTILSPLKKVSEPGKYDLLIRVKGGGIEAQVIATRLGISRALIIEDDTRKVELKPVGYLTRDPRRKERKKYGLRKARKRSQFSKR
ncbi:MAG: 30S ribosomal protein S9 [Candidatus Rhabdochlamydia sp.]